VIDVAAVRSHFPALRSGTLYFDNPGGTQIAREALERMQAYLVGMNANHGGAFSSSRDSDALVLEARRAVADFLGARPEEIVFGQNMTSLTLHVSRSLARELEAGDEIVLTRLEHDANVSPWLLIARDRECRVRWVDFDPADCAWGVEELGRQITRRTRIVAVGWASNATGTINPIAEAVRLAHEAGALCFVDAVHYAPHGPIDVGALGCDLLACSAYKFFGPHTGVLFGRYDLLDRLSAYKVRPAADTPPGKWETGTQSFESIAGVLGAIEYLTWLGESAGASVAGGTRSEPAAHEPSDRRRALRAVMASIGEYERLLSRAMLEGLTAVKGLRIYGLADPAALALRVPTYAFTFSGWHPRRICEELDRQGIYAWDGNYYAPEVTRRLGLEDSGGMVRVGAVHYNTLEEVERLVAAVRGLAG
jgi:cysteine desulfurase family protein (TIGR01976 family)